MRTTLTIDDDLFAGLRRRAAESGKSYKQVVNETLRAGLSAGSKPAPQPYRLQPARMGRPRPGIDLTKSLAVADALEDEALLDKFEQRK